MVKLANFKEDSKGRNLLVYDYGVVGKNEARKLEVQLDARDSAAKGAAGLVPEANTSLRLVDRKTHYPDAEGKAQAILEIQKAEAEAIKVLNEAKPSKEILALKSFETFEKVADGKSTKILIPSEIQNLAGLVKSIKEID